MCDCVKHVTLRDVGKSWNWKVHRQHSFITQTTHAPNVLLPPVSRRSSAGSSSLRSGKDTTTLVPGGSRGFAFSQAKTSAHSIRRRCRSCASCELKYRFPLHVKPGASSSWACTNRARSLRSCFDAAPPRVRRLRLRRGLCATQLRWRSTTPSPRANTQAIAAMPCGVIDFTFSSDHKQIDGNLGLRVQQRLTYLVAWSALPPWC